MLGATKVCMARRILHQKTARIQDRYCNILYKKNYFPWNMHKQHWHA